MVRVSAKEYNKVEDAETKEQDYFSNCKLVPSWMRVNATCFHRLKSQATHKHALHNILDKWKKSGKKQKRHEKIWNYWKKAIPLHRI